MFKEIAQFQTKHPKHKKKKPKENKLTGKKLNVKLAKMSLFPSDSKKYQYTHRINATTNQPFQ